ncbi:MAG TPA: cupin domain-containing protein [Flavisolibacter sp.]|jgi:mannose-6-phosphate isomerase-like protein (cupin superfamily)|nr:cupin domain-containing protein [Flavisolibacter sp.]
MNFHTSIQQAKEKLAKEGKDPFVVLIKNGDMSVEYYKPSDTDKQTAHKQDEVYVIASGSGKFLSGNNIIEFTNGDVLFVPAGMSHHFQDFTQDFATWVIFYGPPKSQ